MIKGIIFDLDGTILDTSEDLTTAVNRTRVYFHLNPISKEVVLNGLGNGFMVLMEKTIPEIDSRETLEVFKKEYAQCYMEQTKPYEGIPEHLKELNSKGIKVAVNSNKDDRYTKNLIRENFPDIEFVDVLGTVPERKKKPDPEAVCLIMKEMNLSKEEIVYCGDSDVDIKTANNAGLLAISCTWGFRSKEWLKENGAAILIDEPNEILKYLSTI